jgi:glycosyltransferase involved in cell wall biosynthesis
MARHPLTPDFSNSPVSPLRPRYHYQPAGDGARPAVSVIVPYYNTGELFHETARSVLGQSLQQWEMIVVNDGSQDPAALRVLDEYRDGDPRIRVLDLEANRGLPGARNAGLAAAQADKVFFLDSDDLIEPTALEKMAWCLDAYPEYAFCKGFTVNFGALRVMSQARFEDGDLFLRRNVVTILAMVRRDVARSVGGFDESLVTGLEDWDFWLRCAAQGHWGRTIPEPFDWYRRRTGHTNRWESWTDEGLKRIRTELRHRYPEPFAKGIPRITPAPLAPYRPLVEEAPFANRLAKDKERVLFLLPWMAMGGADKFNLDAIGQLKERGIECTIATTLAANYPWYRQFAQLTPDIFILPNFLQQSDYPRFLHYLIESRGIDWVLVSNSELGYKLLPYLRSRCPAVTFVDYSHMEEENWNSGGHPRSGVGYQELLDMNIVASDHLKQWMVDKGANVDRIEVCTTNVDTAQFAPDPETRKRIRAEFKISSSTPVILYAGRLCEQKQPQIFAATMRALKDRKVHFVSLVAGDGEDRTWLARYLRTHRLQKKVWMLGAVGQERMRDLLAAADILFLPSKMEGVSLLIYEAMSTGVVPVGADVGGQKELVTPDCGILMKPGTPEEQVAFYADALERLIRQPELRASMGAAAAARVRAGFDLKQMGDRLEALLQQARERHRTDPQPAVGLGLGRESTIQALEYHRLSSSTSGLEKYRKVERALHGLIGRLAPWVGGFRRVMGPLRRFLDRHIANPLRQAKEAVWITGHAVKVRLGLASEQEDS